MTLSTQRNLKTKEIMIKICECGSIIPITVVITKEKNEVYLAKRITLRSGNPGVKHQVAILEICFTSYTSSNMKFTSFKMESFP